MKRLVSIVIVLLLSSTIALAQDFCKGDFAFDGDVDGEDLSEFLAHFSRGQYSNPCPPDGATPVPQTGQTTSYAPYDDGYFESGVALATPRFTDNGDATVTDNQTGLIWMKNAGCSLTMTWDDALYFCNAVSSSTCGLTDGSNTGDWRLPNRRELFSLVHEDYYNPVLSNMAGTGHWTEGNPFINIQSIDVLSLHYWSSTTNPAYTHTAWSITMYDGYLHPSDKYDTNYVWCVRGGH